MKKLAQLTLSLALVTLLTPLVSREAPSSPCPRGWSRT